MSVSATMKPQSFDPPPAWHVAVHLDAYSKWTRMHSRGPPRSALHRVPKRQQPWRASESFPNSDGVIGSDGLLH
jgi:hypothetical protein